jgi:hypothetical protein
LTLGAFLWFAWNSVFLFDQIGAKTSAVIFDKGGFYMLGIGISLGALTYGILHEVILKLPLTDVITRRITRSALAGVGLMFILPHIAHYPVEQHLESEGYELCDKASYQWLLYRKIVYVSSPEVCAGLSKKKK